MHEALRNTVLNRPFNNASVFHRVTGRPINPKFGGNCIELSDELIKAVLESGEADEAHIMDIEGEGVHGGVLARKGSNLFYLDPGYMQLEPICVSAIPIRQSVAVGCLPTIDGVHSEFRVLRLTQNRIEAKREVQSKPIASCLVQSFDLRSTRKTQRPPDPYGVLEETRHLLFRFPMGAAEVRLRSDVEELRTDCLVVNSEGRGTILPLSGFNLNADRVLNCVERKFDVDRRELLDHLHEGAQIYREIHSL